MKLKVNEILTISRIINLIPTSGMESRTKIKVLKNSIMLQKAVDEYNKLIQNLQNKLKPEGFDELQSKFGNIDNSDDPDYNTYKEQLLKLKEEFNEALTKILNEDELEVAFNPFNDDDLVHIADMLPSGESKKININGSEIELTNDELLNAIVATLC